MDPMLISKIMFWFAFFFDFHFYLFLCFFLFFYLLLWVHYWLFHVVVNGHVVWDLFLFLFFFLTTFFLLKFGMTALHLAADKGFEQIVKILVENGANVHLQDQVFIFFFISLFFSDFICCCGFILDCFMLILNGCVVWYLFCFYSFFNNFLFVKVWKGRSSQSCYQRFWTNC